MPDKAIYFKAYDQLSLYYTAKLIESSKASIVFVHGVGEHIGRYVEAIQVFSEHGYSCFGFDQRGFGRSEGERGHVNAFSEYVEDLAKFVEEIVRPESGKQIFLLGHSMGSIVSLAYALRYPKKIQGILLFSCPLKLVSNVANFGGLLAELFLSFTPKLKLSNHINPDALSDNKENIQALRADPYAYNTVSVNWLREFRLARADILNHARQLKIPVLINHGDADTIAALSGAKILYAALGSQDKTLSIYPGLKHELLNHLPAEREKVLEQTIAWLDSSLSVGQSFYLS